MTTLWKGGASSYTANFIFEDPVLHPYQRRSEKRLNLILEQLDLGSEANLGYTKVTWLPDEIVRVRYLAMEGILEPIIVVRVEFQPSFKEAFDQERLKEVIEQLTQEIIDEAEEELPETYIPFAWVGIAAIDHALAGPFEGNGSCPFWGYPVDPHLAGFEPNLQGDNLVDLGFDNSCETQPGFLTAGNDWLNNVPGGSEQLFLRLNGGQTWTLNQFALDQGTFQDSDWYLSANGVAQSSHGGMVAMEHTDTQATLPDAASEGVGAGYWKRSIILAPGGAPLPEGDVAYTVQMGGGATAAIKATYSGGTIFSQSLLGHYEIQFFGRSFHCECTSARIHVRVITGAVGGSISTFDFFPGDIGQPPIANRMVYDRDVSLGGLPPCGGSQLARGPNDGGQGWSNRALFINLQTGNVFDGTANRRQPYFSGGCGASYHPGPDHPDCIGGCTGETTVQPANNLDYPQGIHFITYNAGGQQANIDLRGGVLWHMARVAQVDAATRHICRVILVGNDGAEGACACRPFSYGHNMPALGIDPDIPLGSNLTQLCGAEQCQVPYSVGELVTVVGVTNPFSTFCAQMTGDWRLIVTKPQGGHGEVFTNRFWSELRCPSSGPVEKFFKEVERAFRNRSACDGPPLAVKCNAGEECSGQLRCIE
jgi:hypothetical protein